MTQGIWEYGKLLWHDLGEFIFAFIPYDKFWILKNVNKRALITETENSLLSTCTFNGNSKVKWAVLTSVISFVVMPDDATPRTKLPSIEHM